MRGYLEEAKKAGYLHSATVVLLPEYLGTWLVTENEKDGVATASTIQSSMTLMVLSNPIKFLGSFFQHQGEQDRFAAGLFRMKAKSMATIYSNTFRKLAREYQVTINAGSIVLPGAHVQDTVIDVREDQPLYNSSFIFYPTGLIDERVVKKSFPIHSELPFITAAPIEDLPLFDLSIGKTAVLVCADSWYPQSYARIASLHADVVLVNSYCAGDQTMSIKWNGYDGIAPPSDIDTLDIRKISERDAWIKYALPGRLAESKAIVGANIFLRGTLWDLGTDGQPFFVAGDRLLDIGKSSRAGIWNFCF
jgi:predicted amidohydrolase